MATVYVYIYNEINNNLCLPENLFNAGCEIECLKGMAPDDGEAIDSYGKYRIDCLDSDWKDVVEKLRLSGKSLIYSVILNGTDGKFVVADAGELNSEVRHYPTRISDAKQVFAYWFEDLASLGRDWVVA